MSVMSGRTSGCRRLICCLCRHDLDQVMRPVCLLATLAVAFSNSIKTCMEAPAPKPSLALFKLKPSCPTLSVMQMRTRDSGQVSITECSYTEVDEQLTSTPQGPSINSVPPAAMAAAAAAAGIDAISSVSSDADEGSSPSGPPSFGSSFVSDDDPYAWAQKLRRIPDKVC